jgi:hypothetical protein
VSCERPVCLLVLLLPFSRLESPTLRHLAYVTLTVASRSSPLRAANGIAKCEKCPESKQVRSLRFGCSALLVGLVWAVFLGPSACIAVGVLICVEARRLLLHFVLRANSV